MEHMLYCSLIRISESLSMDGMGSGVSRVQKQSCSESAETYFSMNSFEIFCSYLGLMEGPKTKQICFVNCSSR